MKILAVDSSSQTSAVALCEDERLISSFMQNNGNTHSQTLLPMIEQMLKINGTDIEDIDIFALSCGPGSFTGVRIGAATVKGLAFGKNKPCVAVSTLQVLAENLKGFHGIICPVMNARRSQLYNALFMSDGENIKRLCNDRLIVESELACELSQYNEKIYFCGDGYNIAKKACASLLTENTPEQLRYPSGYSVASYALRAYKNGDYTDDKKLVPSYLRASQAERELKEKINNEVKK